MKHKDWLIALAIAAAVPISLVLIRLDDRSTDRNFVHALDVAKIRYPNFPSAVAVGHKICELLDRGIPLINVVVGEVAVGAANTLPRANYLVVSAALTYCPEYVVPREPVGQVV